MTYLFSPSSPDFSPDQENIGLKPGLFIASYPLAKANGNLYAQDVVSLPRNAAKLPFLHPK